LELGGEGRREENGFLRALVLLGMREGRGETIRRSFAAWSTAARHVAGGPRSVVGMMMGDTG
jgi:hypothetical protein